MKKTLSLGIIIALSLFSTSCGLLHHLAELPHQQHASNGNHHGHQSKHRSHHASHKSRHHQQKHSDRHSSRHSR